MTIFFWLFIFFSVKPKIFGRPKKSSQMGCLGMEDADDRNVKTAKSMHDTWHRLVEEAQNVTVKHLTFVEPIKSRNVKHVLPALSRIYARLRSFGLPVYRLHSDRQRVLL